MLDINWKMIPINITSPQLQDLQDLHIQHIPKPSESAPRNITEHHHVPPVYESWSHHVASSWASIGLASAVAMILPWNHCGNGKNCWQKI